MDNLLLCRGCGARYRLKRELNGKTARCRKCGAVLHPAASLLRDDAGETSPTMPQAASSRRPRRHLLWIGALALLLSIGAVPLVWLWMTAPVREPETAVNDQEEDAFLVQDAGIGEPVESHELLLADAALAEDASRTVSPSANEEHPGDTDRYGNRVVPTEAVLEVTMPEGTTVSFDGVDGTVDGRSFTFQDMSPAEYRQRAASFRFPGGETVERRFMLRGGQVTRISMTAPQSSWPRLLLNTRKHAKQVDHVEFSPDGRRLLSCAEESVLWDLDHGCALHVFEAPFAAFTPDGAGIVTVSSRRDAANVHCEIMLWDAVSGKLIEQDERSATIVSRPLSIPYAPELELGLRELTAQLAQWLYTEGMTSHVRRIGGFWHQDPVRKYGSAVPFDPPELPPWRHVVLSADGQVAAIQTFSGAIDVFSTGSPLRPLSSCLPPMTGSKYPRPVQPTAVALRPDGERVVASYGRELLWFDASTGERIEIRYEPADAEVGALWEQRHLGISKTAEGMVIGGTRSPGNKFPSYSPDGSLLCLFNTAFNADESRMIVVGSSQVFDSRTGEEVFKIPPLDLPGIQPDIGRSVFRVTSSAIRGDGLMVAAGLNNGQMHLWDLDEEPAGAVRGFPVGHWGHEKIRSIRLTGDGSGILLELGPPLYDPESGQFVREMFDGSEHALIVDETNEVWASPAGYRIVGRAFHNRSNLGVNLRAMPPALIPVSRLNEALILAIHHPDGTLPLPRSADGVDPTETGDSASNDDVGVVIARQVELCRQYGATDEEIERFRIFVTGLADGGMTAEQIERHAEHFRGRLRTKARQESRGVWQLVVWDAKKERIVRASPNRVGTPVWRSTYGYEVRWPLSPDGRRAVTVSREAGDSSHRLLVTVWNTETCEPLQSFSEPLDRPDRIVTRFSHEGQYLFTATVRDRDIVFTTWDVVTGRPLRSVRWQTPATPVHIAISPDGQTVAAESGRIWDAVTGEELEPFVGGQFLTFDEEGRLFVVAGAEAARQVLEQESASQHVNWKHSHSVLICESPRRRRAHRALDSTTLPITDVQISPNGRTLLVTAGWTGFTRLMAWDLWTGSLKLTVDKQLYRAGVDPSPVSREVLPLDFTQALLTPDGQKVLLVMTVAKTFQKTSTARSVEVWDLESERFIGTIPDAPRRLEPFCQDAQGNWLLVGLEGCWDPKNCEKAEVPEDAKSDEVPKRSVAPSTWQRRPLVLKDGNLVEARSRDHKDYLIPAPIPGTEALLVSESSHTFSKPPTAVLWDEAQKRELLRLEWAAGEVPVVVRLSPDGRRILVGMEDGSVRIVDVATGDELGRLLVLREGWAFLTLEGVFDASREGRQHVFFRFDDSLEALPLDRFLGEFYSPGLLAAAWSGQRPLPGVPPTPGTAPKVEMLVQSTNPETGEAVVEVAVTETGHGVSGPWLAHNGVRLETGIQVRKEGSTATYRFHLSLIEGENRIEARAATADGGIQSKPVLAVLGGGRSLTPPRLFVLTVGINRYASDSGVADLDFCVSDARAIGQLFRDQTGDLYSEVEVTELLDEQATRTNILSAMATLAQRATPHDTLVVFVACHGLTVGQRFYLIPHEFQIPGHLRQTEPPPEESAVEGIAVRGDVVERRITEVRRQGLPIDDLTDQLARVSALKRVLIFDTCQAGGATQLAGGSVNPFAFRGAIQRVGNSQGVYMLAATSAEELAAESGELEHSLLTYALLHAADTDAPGRELDVLDWFGGAAGLVPDLYQKYVGREQQVEVTGTKPGFPILKSPTPRY